MQVTEKTINTVVKNRNSSIEMLRIISMWMIVFYHFHTHVLQYGSDDVFFRAVQIPIHIAVICFILISGYFGINASIKGFSKLVAKIMFYALSITALVLLYGKISGNQVYYSTDYIHQFPYDKGFAINDLLFVSRSPLWFIRSYLLLYMVSPFFNKVLKDQSKQERLFLLIVLGFITLWVDLLRVDGMGGGKSILNFCFIYSIGRTIKDYNILKLVSRKQNLLMYIALTLSVIVIYVIFDGSSFGSMIGALSFRYNGVICIISAILFFMLFARTYFSSNIINTVSSSVFAIYLIHEHPIINNYIYTTVDLLQQDNGLALLYVYLFLYSMAIMIAAVIIDKLTMPSQNGIAKMISCALTLVGRKLGIIENER